MKYCIAGRHQYSTLRDADEVRVRYEDKDRIIDFVERIPDKTIIMDMPNFDVDYPTWHMYDEKFEGGFCLALYQLTRAQELNEEGIKWYWPFPITSYYELREILMLNPTYVLIGAPLSFDLDNVRKVVGKDIKIRMTCNCARPAHLIVNADLKGFTGHWIRPEDGDTYGKVVDVLEFDAVRDDLKKEAALLHVYKDNKTWPGNLNLLLTHLNVNVDNRAILEEIGERRMNCKQRCMRNGTCHFCETAFMFAEQIRLEHIERRKKSNIDNN